MKAIGKLIYFAAMLLIISCNEPSVEHYSSTQEFFAKNNVTMQTYSINGSTGGSFTSPQGTVVTIPANAFVTQSSIPVTGTVTIQFKDLYKKSDMLLADMSTITAWGAPLKSGGEFFIKASFNNSAILLAPGKKITVAQPAALTGGIDSLNVQEPFVAGLDSSALGFVWYTSPSDSVHSLVNSYVFSLYEFSMPVDSGTWCNSDNSSYFSGYPQTTLTLHANDAYADYHQEVFLIFNGISSMIHVYMQMVHNYPYYYAPQGLQCTMVAFGVKDGELYSSFVPITIGSNQTVNFSLSHTTTADFKTQLEALN